MAFFTDAEYEMAEDEYYGEEIPGGLSHRSCRLLGAVCG